MLTTGEQVRGQWLSGQPVALDIPWQRQHLSLLGLVFSCVGMMGGCVSVLRNARSHSWTSKPVVFSPASVSPSCVVRPSRIRFILVQPWISPCAVPN
jgi:hypothetical protein